METGRFKLPENNVSPESFDSIIEEARRKNRADSESAKFSVADRERLGLLSLQAAEKSSGRKSFERVNAETISKKELLSLVGDIRVGTTNLRHVYEANLISEKGLRRLLEAYQTGGDVRRLLAEELLIRELRFERDPNLRDQSISTSESAETSTEAHMESAGDTRENDVIEPPKKSKRSKAKSPKKAAVRAKVRYVPASLIAANVTALVVLGVLLLVLLLVIYFRH